MTHRVHTTKVKGHKPVRRSIVPKAIDEPSLDRAAQVGLPVHVRATDRSLARAQADWSAVRRLIAQDKLVKIKHETQTFYMRKL